MTAQSEIPTSCLWDNLNIIHFTAVTSITGLVYTQ